MCISTKWPFQPSVHSTKWHSTKCTQFAGDAAAASNAAGDSVGDTSGDAVDCAAASLETVVIR